MLKELLKDKHIILASRSPRRQHFFKELGLDFEIRLKEVDEIYPPKLKHFEISDYLAQLKSLPFEEELKENDILITSDTIVWHNDTALGKPRNEKEAFEMLSSMSDTTHEVITSVCFKTTSFQKTVASVTKVTFKALTKDEINYYIKNYKPFDKAGGYGIQEWIGAIGITKIEGNYNTVVGLPVNVVYRELLNLL
ncbi:MAG: septum formation protein Maf [Kordia sp.]|nr:MAG: septum formation protein Maf [Kordia sp.]